MNCKKIKKKMLRVNLLYNFEVLKHILEFQGFTHIKKFTNFKCN